jgi:hypothetical protein
MTKEKQVTLKLDSKTALELLQVLDSSVAGYSKEYAPERIVRLRNLMSNLDQELEKVILE